MARVERLITDEAIQGELDTYNPLVPEPGQLCATLFLELTSEEELRTWLPRLVGIERSVALRAGAGEQARLLRAQPEAAHAGQLTREEITASVHYVTWHLDADEIALVAAGPVAAVLDHPSYTEEAALSEPTRAELLADLCGGV
jgi:hypothetical protein